MQAVDSLHYVDLPFSGEALELFPSACAFVHSFNADRPAAMELVGLDFPQWTGAPAIEVTCLRVLGSATALADFFRQSKVIRLCSIAGISAVPAPVPAGRALSAISRDNRSDRFKPSHARRLERRALARGDADPVGVMSRPLVSAAVPVTSRSTKQDFLLKLKKVPYEGARTVVFTAYGLCKDGGVPQF